MLLVPLLVGIVFVFMAIMTRIEQRGDVERPPEFTLTAAPEPRCRSPLAEAFPDLTLWVPTDDLHRQISDGADFGSAGPDIVIRSASRRPEHRAGHLTDAA